MLLEIMETADAVVNFVTDNSIPQANIQAIIEKDGQWYLFHWGP